MNKVKPGYWTVCFVILFANSAMALELGCGPNPPAFLAGEVVDVGPGGLALCVRGSEHSQAAVVGIILAGGNPVSVDTRVGDEVVLQPAWPDGVADGFESIADLVTCLPSSSRCEGVSLVLRFRAELTPVPPGRPAIIR